MLQQIEEPTQSSFGIALEAVRRVKNGESHYFSQYLLSPFIEFSDIIFTLKMLVMLSVVRFVVSGTQHPQLRNWPCLFRHLLKGIAKPKREHKLSENAWYACWHTASFCFGVYVLYVEGIQADAPGWIRMLLRDLNVRWYWFPTEAEQLFGNKGWPIFPISNVLRFYYLSELAFWISCLAFLSFETVRADFNALLLHHVVTCALIAFSYTTSFWRIGCIILLTHDIADIVLYSTKAVYYSKAPGFIVDLLFILFALSFFVSRLVIFPIFCLRPALDSSNWLSWTNGALASHWQIPGGIVLPACLCVLQILHVFWFGLIIKMIRRTLVSKSSVAQDGDIRSDDEHEDGADETSVDSISSTSDTSDDEMREPERHKRMKISSLPGVRATVAVTKRVSRKPAGISGDTGNSGSEVPASSKLVTN